MKQATGTQNTFSLPLSNTSVQSAMITMREMFRTYLPEFSLNEILATLDEISEHYADFQFA
jgi:hypothetical protein